MQIYFCTEIVDLFYTTNIATKVLTMTIRVLEENKDMNFEFENILGIIDGVDA